MEKVKKTLVFAEGTDLQRLLNFVADFGAIDNLRGYPNNEIVETATGRVIMKAPSIEGEAYPFTWDALAIMLGLTTVNRPEYKDYLFAIAAE